MGRYFVYCRRGEGGGKGWVLVGEVEGVGSVVGEVLVIVG